MQRINEIKSIMRRLKESTNESLTHTVNEETETENDTSAMDLMLARLEDLLSRLEKDIVGLTPDSDDEDENSETPAEDEEPEDEPAEDEDDTEEPEEEPTEDEDSKDDSAEESLERRIANLERRFTESRRRSLCRRFVR